MAAQLKTPGVYIVEENAFPDLFGAGDVAVPVFIGYTEKAEHNGLLIKSKAIRIHSLAEFETLFGKGPGASMQFSLEAFVAGTAASPVKQVLVFDGETVVLSLQSGAFRLYHSIKLFYANGGKDCYIISVAGYDELPTLATLSRGLAIAEKEQEPNILVIPDAVSLPAADHAALVQLSLLHCEETQRRVTILDVFNGAVSDTSLVDGVIQDFRDHIGSKGLCFGAAYFPWLITGIVLRVEISFMNLPVNLGMYLEKEAQVLHALEAATALRSAATLKNSEAEQMRLILEAHTALSAVSKRYHQLVTAALAVANVLPPSGAMAGMYRFTDITRGISKAPVNVTLAAVIAPTVNLTDTQQMGLNVDDSGKSVNALRAFSMKGVMAWGAKTLADIDPDFRYINVRRTLIMIEQSVKIAVQAFVFEPNDANTWVSIKTVIEHYLTALWKKETVVGATPAEAFSVLIGLGETMSADDILQGYMRVTVLVAVSHATEFIAVTVLQEMQKA